MNVRRKTLVNLRHGRASRLILFSLAGLAAALALVAPPVPATEAGCYFPYLVDSLPHATMGAVYSQQITYCCPRPWCDFIPWFEEPESDVPPGLTFSRDGLVSGPMSTPGTYSLDIVFCGHQIPACEVLQEKIYTFVVDGINEQPTFSAGGDVSVLQDDLPYSAIWATNISKGGPEDALQTLAFHVSNDNNALFSEQPAIAEDGTLSFTLAPDANGVATATVYLSDNGGVANGGISNSPRATFHINVAPYDQPQRGPVFTPTGTDWATDGACTKHNCTLREAIKAANKYGGDPYFGQPSTIELTPGAVYSVDGVDNTSDDAGPNGLPQITSNITINGHGAHIARSATAPDARLIDVAGGFLTLNEVSLENGRAGLGIYTNTVGGAILDEGQLTVKNSFFLHNYAQAGGALFNPGGPSAAIYNSTFYGNESGDGVIHSYGSLDLYNNTFYDNAGNTVSTLSLGSASNTKYTFYNNLFASSSTSVPLCNSGMSTLLITQAGNLATDRSCAGFAVTTYAAVKAVSPPDLNGGLTKNIALQQGSSAIDIGNATACLNANLANRDQRGSPRFIDGNGDGVAQCDAGAYEYGTPPPPSPGPSPQPPQVSVLLSPATPDGSNGWYLGPVTVQPQAGDESPVIELRCALDPQGTPATFDDLPPDLCPFLGGKQVESDGAHTFYAAAMDL